MCYIYDNRILCYFDIPGYNMDKLGRHNPKWKKLVTKGQILYDSTQILKLLVSILEDLAIFSFCSI